MISWQRIGCGRGEVERLVVAHHAPTMRAVPKCARASIRLRLAFMTVGPEAQLGEVHHAQTLRLLAEPREGNVTCISRAGRVCRSR